jgi:multiple sugar transport system permease protein
MTTSIVVPPQPVGAATRRRAPAPRTRFGGARPGMSYVFLAPYLALTIAFGVLPALYALVLAFTDGTGAFIGFDNFTKVVSDFRFGPAVVHVAIYLVIWLVSLVVLVTVLALVVHAIKVRWLSTTLRFVFYLPGALAGASSVLLWLFVLDRPAVPSAACCSFSDSRVSCR